MFSSHDAASVCRRVVDVEIIELPGRAIAVELFRLGIRAGALQKIGENFQMLRPHLFFTQSAPSDLTEPRTNKPRLIQRIPKRIPGIAQHNQLPDCAMKALMWPMIAMHHDVDALHGNAAARWKHCP